MIVPTGIEAAALKALEKSLTSALSRIGKRLWTGYLSPSARRNKAATDVVKRLIDPDLAKQLSLKAILPTLPTGVSPVRVKTSLGGATYQGLTHELAAARLLKMPEQVVNRIRENMRVATRLEFIRTGADTEELMIFGGALFDELDRVVVDLVSSIEGAQPVVLAEVRQSAALTLLTASIDGINRHNSFLKGSESLIDAAALADWEGTYRTQVKAGHGYIEPPDFERKRKIPIESLFVAPQVRLRDDHDSGSATDVWSLHGAIDRTVLLGDPGGGKSTASNAIAWRAAAQADGPVPFVVVLRTFINHDLSVLEYIERKLATRYQCAAPPHAVEGLLLSGRAIVIFDGLDELIDTTKRRGVTDRVELFCARYPLTRVLVTSRRVGYEEAAMDPLVFEVYELTEFSTENVGCYVRNWFIHVEGTEEQKAYSLAESFMRESVTVPELRKNPLMLALMCIIYRGQNWIPRNRPDMYEHCANLLFDKWDSSRKIYVELKARAYVDSAIKHLAYWMFTESAHVQGVTETALVKEVSNFLASAFNSSLESESAARQFVEFCRGRAWILTDAGTTADGKNLFAFTHRTFMEYFAAYELTRRYDGPESIGKALLPRVAAAEWGIVTELAVQISNKHSRNGAERILKILFGDRRYSSAASRKNIGDFALRCLGFVHVPAALAVEVARAYIEAVLRFGAEGNTLRLEPCVAVSDLQRPVEDEILSVLSSQIADKNSSNKAVAIEIALELPRLMTGNLHEPSAIDRSDFDRSDFDRWAVHRRKLFERLGSEILSKQDDATWFSAWRHGLITLEKLVRDGPRAGAFPLQILFVDTQYHYLRIGWCDWGSFIPERMLQSGADDIEGFPVTMEELEWLGTFIEQLPPPPWLIDSISISALPSNYFDGDFLVEKVTTDYGWTLLTLMLIAAEAQASLGRVGTHPESSRKYYAVMDTFAHKRTTGQELPRWLEELVSGLTLQRRELVQSWLNGDLNFIQ